MPRSDVVIDLRAETIGWEPLHHGLEELDRAGYEPVHLPVLNAQQIAQIDADLPGTLGTHLAGGGAWLIRRRAATVPVSQCGESPDSVPMTAAAIAQQPFIGAAGYASDWPARCRAWRAPDCAIAGPFLLEGELMAHRLTFTHATLFALRERGYRSAILPGIKTAAVPALRERFGAALTRVETVPYMSAARVVICASGSGSNFQAVIDAVAAGTVPLQILGALINRAKVTAHARAAAADIPVQTLLWQKNTHSRADYDAALTATLLAYDADLILLLGWMHVLAPATVSALPACVNIHPAYLPLDAAADVVTLPDGSIQPAFRGAHAVDDALAADCKWIGASVHSVTAMVDRGDMLARAPIPVPSTLLRAEVDRHLHAMEHRLLIASLQDWCATRG